MAANSTVNRILGLPDDYDPDSYAQNLPKTNNVNKNNNPLGNNTPNNPLEAAANTSLPDMSKYITNQNKPALKGLPADIASGYNATTNAIYNGLNNVGGAINRGVVSKADDINSLLDYILGNSNMQSQASQDAQFANKYTGRMGTIVNNNTPQSPTYMPATPDLSNPPVQVNRPNIDRTAEIAAAYQRANNNTGVTVNADGVPVVDNTVGADIARRNAGIDVNQTVNTINAARNMGGGSYMTDNSTEQQKLDRYRSDLASNRRLLDSNIAEQVRILNSDYNIGAKREAAKRLELLRPLAENARLTESSLLQQDNTGLIQQRNNEQVAGINERAADRNTAAQQRLEMLKSSLNPETEFNRQKLAQQKQLTEAVAIVSNMPEGPQKEASLERIRLLAATMGNNSFAKTVPNDEYITAPIETTVETPGEGRRTTKDVKVINKRTGAEYKPKNNVPSNVIEQYKNIEAQIKSNPNAVEREAQLKQLDETKKRFNVSY